MENTKNNMTNMDGSTDKKGKLIVAKKIDNSYMAGGKTGKK